MSYVSPFEPGDAPGIVRGPIGAVVIACRGCGAPRYAEPVRGTFVAEKRCDSRCHAATGHKCDCSCGGKNHGAAHAAVRAIKAAA